MQLPFEGRNTISLCGDVIQLPVGNLDYTITEHPEGPTLRPSVGNWNVCDAHYYIPRGGVEWMPEWSSAQIAAGRAAEDARREQHYARKRRWWWRIAGWLGKIRSLFRHPK